MRTPSGKYVPGGKWPGQFQFISHRNGRLGYLDGIRLALQGGCRWIQLRMKNSPEAEIMENALRAKELCDEHSAVLIIDDYVEIAMKVKADGVHLGKNDMPVGEARSMLGNGFIIGGTANTFDDVRDLYAAGADYIGCGPFRFTTTKEKLSPVLGVDGYREITRRMRNCQMDIPLVAIGGITLEDVRHIMETGVNGIAVSGAVLDAPAPDAATALFVEQVAKNMEQQY